MATIPLKIEDKEVSLPVITGSEGEKAIDIRSLRQDTGYITYDDGYGNTGSCLSNITYIDGEAGILRYRGYPIEQLAEQSSFVEVIYLIIYGELPTAAQRARFSGLLTEHAPLREGLIRFIQGFPRDSHPMALLSSSFNALGAYYPHLVANTLNVDKPQFDEAAAIAISKVRTIAAHSYRVAHGLKLNYPNPDLGYCENFLHLMFSQPYRDYVAKPEVAAAVNLFLLLHADHEQNCSTSTVRMVASSGANLFASVSSGVNALWGPLHGGANMAVIEMLKHIHADHDDGTRFIQAAKTGQGHRLMGFGHRVYKNFDPRAQIIKKSFYKALTSLGIKDDPLLNIAMKLEEIALNDDYFISRKLYPNVDFYSGLIMRAIGIPVDMYTVMFAIGRMPGWVAHWHEVATTPKLKIHRPRQIYTGPAKRDFVPMASRG
ncbi:MAG: citrate synthase [Cephaloticoccus sp.]|nr:citrate synthase [Cephaloticoccus sp.]MCF7760612.1 citrate synthase [Cephaloticoccus sp.]